MVSSWDTLRRGKQVIFIEKKVEFQELSWIYILYKFPCNSRLFCYEIL